MRLTAPALADAHLILDPEKLLAFHKDLFGAARMDTNPTPPAPAAPPAPTPPPAPAPAPPAPESLTLTQAELTAKMTSEKQQGERAGVRKFVESLGLDPETVKVEDIKARLDAAQVAENAALSETQRAQKAATDAQALAEKDRADAAADRLAAKKERVLASAGVSAETVTDVSLLLTIKADDDDATVTAAVEALKTRLPGLFGTPTPGTPPPPSGGPIGTPPRPQPSGDAYARGIERAKGLTGAGAPATT